MNPQRYESELPRRKPSAFIFLEKRGDLNESTGVGLGVIEQGYEGELVAGVDGGCVGVGAVEHGLSTRDAEQYRASVPRVVGCDACVEMACYPHALAHAVARLGRTTQ